MILYQMVLKFFFELSPIGVEESSYKEFFTTPERVATRFIELYSLTNQTKP